MLSAQERLGRVLVDEGVLSSEDVERGLSRQRNMGGRLGESLVALGLCAEAHVAHALARQWELPFVDLQQTPPARNVLQRFPVELARSLKVVPVRYETDPYGGERLLVVALNPLDFHIDSAVRRAVGCPVQMAVGLESQIHAALEHYEGLSAWNVQSRPQSPLALGLARRDALQNQRKGLRYSPAPFGAGEQRLTRADANNTIDQRLERGETVEVLLSPEGPRLRASGAGLGSAEELGMLPENAQRLLFQRSPEGGSMKVQ